MMYQLIWFDCKHECDIQNMGIKILNMINWQKTSLNFYLYAHLFNSSYTVRPAGGATSCSTSRRRRRRRKDVFFFTWASNMAARRLKRVAASQPGFLSLKGSSNPEDLLGGRRKRVNKNKKKNWNKHSDINDVEDFLEDVRHQERTTGWVSLMW